MELQLDGTRLEVAWPDGHRSTFHAVWLRDNCPCPDCRHQSGQRLLDTRTIPDDLHLGAAQAGDAHIHVAFDDGHAADYDAGWLRAHCYCGAESLTTARRLWDASIAKELPSLPYDEVAAGGDGLRRWLAFVDELGFAVLTGGPTEPETVTRVAELFGYVRETNYGRLFDVRSVVNPSNLAYTGLGLGGHTDNPYRDPAPTLQLLHCLSSSAGGGENTLVDGFRAAHELRHRDPDAFALLSSRPIRFRYSDEDTQLETEAPVIALDVRGEVCGVRFNTRSAAPFRLAEDEVEAYYRAYQVFGRLLEDDAFRIRFKLEPGDLFVVDNLRVLHGRTAYSEAGERHLQGCYADRDGLRSTLAVLSR
jgi:gamma-butyrobetaine dioxygenase